MTSFGFGIFENLKMQALVECFRFWWHWHTITHEIGNIAMDVIKTKFLPVPVLKRTLKGGSTSCNGAANNIGQRLCWKMRFLNPEKFWAQVLRAGHYSYLVKILCTQICIASDATAIYIVCQWNESYLQALCTLQTMWIRISTAQRKDMQWFIQQKDKRNR